MQKSHFLLSALLSLALLSQAAQAIEAGAGLGDPTKNLTDPSLTPAAAPAVVTAPVTTVAPAAPAVAAPVAAAPATVSTPPAAEPVAAAPLVQSPAAQMALDEIAKNRRRLETQKQEFGEPGPVAKPHYDALVSEMERLQKELEVLPSPTGEALSKIRSPINGLSGKFSSLKMYWKQGTTPAAGAANDNASSSPGIVSGATGGNTSTTTSGVPSTASATPVKAGVLSAPQPVL